MLLLRKLGNLVSGFLACFLFQLSLANPMGKSTDTTERPLRLERISQKDGLSQYTITALLQDATGFLLIGTASGLNRYDGQRFEVFRHNPNEINSISGNWVLSLAQDPFGYYWIGTFHDGLNRYDPKTGDWLHFRHNPEDPHSIHSNRIWALHVDKQGYLWIAGNDGLSRLKLAQTYPTPTFERYIDDSNENIDNKSVVTFLEEDDGTLWMAGYYVPLKRYVPSQNTLELFFDESADPTGKRITQLLKDPTGHIWISSRDGLLTRLDPNTRQAQNFSISGSKKVGILSMAVVDGQLWLGCKGAGLNTMNLADFSVQRINPTYLDQRGDNSFMEMDHVVSMLEDRGNVLWFATANGLYKYANRHKKFKHHILAVEDSTIPESLTAVYAASKNSVWIAPANEGVLHYDSENGTLKHYSHNRDDDSSLLDDRIWNINSDNSGAIWFSTKSGLSRWLPETESFENLSTEDGLNGSSRVFLLQDRNNTYWSAAWSAGVDCFRLEDGRMVQHQVFHQEKNERNVLCGVSVDDGSVWLGYSNGISRYIREENHFNRRDFPGSGIPGSLSTPVVTALFQSRDGTIWVGTQAGLNRYHKETDTFSWILEEDGLPSNNIRKILEDLPGNLWVFTDNGIARVAVDGSIRNFDTYDGLPGHEYEQAGASITPSGEIFTANMRGLGSFYPDQLGHNRQEPAVVFTGVSRLGTAINDYHKPLTFSYKDNLISFDFAVLDYNSPWKNGYAYKLDGFNESWVRTETGSISFTNLDSGKYRLHVKGSNNDGFWNNEGSSLDFYVQAPPWLSTWAIVCYFLIAVVALALYVRWAKMRHIVDELQKIDRLKDQIMANTSHELKTPLGGVIGLVESLLDGAGGELPPKAVHDLNMVLRSGRRLSSLVNDILDISQIQSRNLKLNAQSLDARVLGDVVVQLCKPLVGGKKLVLENKIPEDLPTVYADADRFQQILFNLLGNAIKFTEQGHVILAAHVKDDRAFFTVTDTGIGIAPDRQKIIFQAFQQADGSVSRKYGGTGLGLAVCKQLVQLHGGHMTVSSQLDHGSCFQFDLPLSREPAQPLEHRVLTHSQQGRFQTLANADSDVDRLQPLIQNNSLTGITYKILVVDDEPVNRLLISNFLSGETQYRLSEAQDGFQALAICKESGPFDLVLLDLMMPKMSGFEVCQELRKSHAIHEMPILFLSARNQVKDLNEAYSSGANDYITKPFTKDELLSRVETHLRLLDITRNLEEKVAERTAELQEKNNQIIRAQKRLILHEKTTYLGSLASGMAHELQNPLNFINNMTSFAMESLTSLEPIQPKLKDALPGDVYEVLEEALDEMLEYNRVVEKHGERASLIIKSLMAFARERKDMSQTIIINDFVGQYAKVPLSNRKEEADAIEVTWELDPSLGTITLNSLDLSRILMNVMNNAIDSCSEKQRGNPDATALIHISTTQHEDHLVIAIRDNGVGIDPTHKEKVFQPFFTTKVSPHRIGLGLTLCHDMVARGMGGDLYFESEGDWTTFYISIPMVENASPVKGTNSPSPGMD